MMERYVLGYSAWGRPVFCEQGGTGRRRALFCAAFHGSEWITGAVLQRFQACFRRRPDWQAQATLWAVPWVNPDGAALAMGLLPTWSPQYIVSRAIGGGDPGFPFTWKANGRGVDLNLNYPADWEGAVRVKGLHGPAPMNWPGPCPLSEPESRLMAELAERVRPDVLVTLHAQGEEIYWQYRSFGPPEAEALGEAMARRSGYLLTEVPPESSRAGYKDWFLQKFRRPAYTVECGLGANPLPLSQLDGICAHVLPLLETALLGENAGDDCNFSLPMV